MSPGRPTASLLLSDTPVPDCTPSPPPTDNPPLARPPRSTPRTPYCEACSSFSAAADSFLADISVSGLLISAGAGVAAPPLPQGEVSVLEAVGASELEAEGSALAPAAVSAVLVVAAAFGLARAVSVLLPRAVLSVVAVSASVAVGELQRLLLVGGVVCF